ncbi:hypothetical protein WDW37_06115 [Bdellovibrionota bacterium FG-1]
MIQRFKITPFLFLLLGAWSCSSAGKKGVSDAPSRGVAPHAIHRLIPYTLRVRRPAGPGANPLAGPGGEDFTSHPLPDAKFDCEPPVAMFRDFKMNEIRECLKSVQKDPNQKSTKIAYRLKRIDIPVMELENPESAPDCVRKLLPNIPVPREIFFQSSEEGALLCYSARLDVEANEKMGIRLPTHRLTVKVDLASLKISEIPEGPEGDAEWGMLLFAWAISPLWTEQMRVLPSHIVPDYLCATCLGEKTMVKPGGPPPKLWP